MKKLDAYFLRLPWYTILQDASENEKLVEEYFKMFDIKVDKLIGSKDFDNSLICNEELKFNLDNNIEFSFEYFTEKKLKVNAGKLLEKYWQEKIIIMKSSGELDENKVYLHSSFGKDDNYSLSDKKNKLNNVVDSFIRKYTDPNDWKDIIKKKSEKKEKLEVDVNLGLAVCEIAMIILNKKIDKNKIDNKNYGSFSLQLTKVERIYRIFFDALKDEEKFDKTYDRQISFWKTEKQLIPDWFQNSHWIGYVRNDSGVNYQNKSKTVEWAISKSYLYIGETSIDNFTPVKLETAYGNNKYQNIGIITYEKNKRYLIGHLTRIFDKETNNSTPGFIFFPVHDEDQQELAIGILVYFSMHHEEFISKRIIWKNTNMKHKPSIIDIDSEEFNNLEDSIKQFLYNRDRNQMLIPSHSVSYLEENKGLRSLDYLMKSITSEFESDNLLNSLIDEFHVCLLDVPVPSKSDYNFIDFLIKNIQIDYLKINFDKNRIEFNAYFVHTFNNNTNEYFGYARKQAQTVQLILHCQKNKESNPQEIYPSKYASERIALLNIFLPTFSEVSGKSALDNYPFLPALITGISESQEAVSYKAAIVNTRKFKSKDDFLSNLRNFDDANKLKQFIDYFLDQSTPLKMSITQNFYTFRNEYPNIAKFKKSLGTIAETIDNTDIDKPLEIRILFDKNMTPLLNGRISGTTEDEVKRNVEEFLADYYKNLPQD